jgi:hypothetical protein
MPSWFGLLWQPASAMAASLLRPPKRERSLAFQPERERQKLGKVTEITSRTLKCQRYRSAVSRCLPTAVRQGRRDPQRYVWSPPSSDCRRTVAGPNTGLPLSWVETFLSPMRGFGIAISLRNRPNLSKPGPSDPKRARTHQDPSSPPIYGVTGRQFDTAGRADWARTCKRRFLSWAPVPSA